MKLKKLEHKLTVCKVADIKDIDTGKDFYFIGKTDEEISLVCKTDDVPQNTIERDDGWRGFRIQGVLDFSLIGILSKLSTILAENGIGARKYFYPLTNTFDCFHGAYDINNTPVALHISKRVLTLPLYADLGLEDVDRICDVILSCKKK